MEISATRSPAGDIVTPRPGGAAEFDPRQPNRQWSVPILTPDDMPAHVKCSLLGSSLSIPIRDGAFALGTWQGIYLCEHRDRATPRRIIVTVQGEV